MSAARRGGTSPTSNRFRRVPFLILCLLAADGRILTAAPARATAPAITGPTAREVLEEAVRHWRGQLPERAAEYGRALAALVESDPPRGAALLRGALKRIPRDSRADGLVIGRSLLLLADKAFPLAVEVALSEPERLLGTLYFAFWRLAERDPADGERWAREIVRRSPVTGVRFVSQVALGQLTAQPRPDPARRREAFRRLAETLPPGPVRATLWLEAGLCFLPESREQFWALLRRALEEDAGMQPSLELGLFRAGATPYVDSLLAGVAARDRPTTADWKQLAGEFRAMGAEAGAAGIVRRLAYSDPATAREIAREIRDPSLRALALSEFLDPERRPAPPGGEEAAREVGALLPRIARPALRGFVLYRLARWEEPGDPRMAAEHFAQAFNAVKALKGLDAGVFGNRNDSTTAETIQELLLGYLARFRPEETLRLALGQRPVLGDRFPRLLLRAAAHAPTAAQGDEWLRRYLPPGRRDAVWAEYAVGLAEAHPERIPAVTARIPNLRQRDLALAAAAGALGGRDPAAAVSLSRLIRSPTVRAAALLDATRSAWLLGVPRMLETARAIPLPLIRADALRLAVDRLLNDWGQTRDPAERSRLQEQARDVAAEMPDEGPKWGAMLHIARNLKLADPEAAFQYARQIGRYTERLSAETDVLDWLLQKGTAERALELARQEPSEEGRADLLGAVAQRLSARDPNEAIRLARFVADRPTRDAIFAGAIDTLREKEIDRALALAAELATEPAIRRVYPRLWARALAQQRRPAQVWPLYRWISRAASGADAEWELPASPTRERPDGYEEVIERTLQWLQSFPREEWLPALQPYLQGPEDGRVNAGFTARLAARLAATDPPAGLALAEAANLGDWDWSALVGPLAQHDLAAAERAASRIRTSPPRLTALLALTRAARARGLPDARYRRDATRAAERLAAEIADERSPTAQSARYLGLAQQLDEAGLDGTRYRQLSRAAVRRIGDPVDRARQLREIERSEAGSAPAAKD